MKPHLKVPRKASRKFHKGVYYASEFPVFFPCTFRCVFLIACSVTWVILGRFSFVYFIVLLLFYYCFIIVLLLFYYCFIIVLLLARSLLIPCSLLMCLTAVLPQIPQITQRNAAGLHYFADKRQLAQMNLLKQMPQIIAEKDSYHIVECCSCLYNKSVREPACSFLVLSLPFPYSFLVLSFLALSLLFTYVIQTAVLTESKCRNKRKKRPNIDYRAL